MCNILYEDNHILVVEKPVNLPVQADSSKDPDLLSLLKAYIKEKYEKPGAVYLGLVHRLDRPVGGVMVFARTSKAAERLSSQFRGHGAVKRYAALVSGKPEAHALLEDYLLRDPSSGTVRTAAQDTPGAQRALLEYRRIAEIGDLSLLDIGLKTGRHHQIRVQLSSRNLPIWGDARYNPAAKPGQQIALWAYSLSFEHPTKKERMTFQCLPKDGAWKPFSLQLLALAQEIEIAYQDDNIIAVNKRAGMTVTDPEETDTLETRLNGLFGKVYPVHRLDRNTTGLVLFAKNTAAEAALTKAIEGRTLKKFYRCIVRGVPSPAAARLTAWGVKDEKAARLHVFNAPRPDAKELVTAYRTLASDGRRSLLEVELVTGRTHQIRAHLAFIGYPLLGDDKYGDREFNRLEKTQRIALSAVRIEFTFDRSSPLYYLNGITLKAEAGFSFSQEATAFPGADTDKDKNI